MAEVLHTSPNSMKAECFNLLYILVFHLKFSIKYSASKSKLKNIKPVYHIPESVPPDLGNVSWSLWLCVESMEAVYKEERAHEAPNSTKASYSLPFSHAMSAGIMQ